MAGIRKFHGDDSRDISAKGRDIFNGCVPEDLPIEVEVGMCDSVSHGDELPPRDLRVAIAEGRGLARDGFANYGEVMQHSGRPDFVFQEGGFCRCGDNCFYLVAGGKYVS